MSSISVAGDTSGSVTLQAPAVAGASVLTLPVATDTLVGKATTDTLTNKTLTSPTISGAVVSAMGSSVLTSGTAVASTSGTSINFTSIPNWAKRITVMFNGVSTSGASQILVQIGSGSVTTTGYLSYVGATQSGSNGSTAFTTGFGVDCATTTTNNVRYGHMVITSFGSNTYIESINIGDPNIGGGRSYTGGGSVTLSGFLDRVRITTVNGTDTFDAGSINIMYE